MSLRQDIAIAATDDKLADLRDARTRRDPRMDRLLELRARGIPRDRAQEMVDREFLGEDAE